jgi:hypothetical protein
MIWNIKSEANKTEERNERKRENRGNAMDTRIISAAFC